METAWIAVVLISALVLTLIAVVMLSILGAWYGTMFGMAWTWLRVHLFARGSGRGREQILAPPVVHRK
jgi:hypothetical protein